MDGQLPVSKIRTMQQVISESSARQNFNTLLLTIFAGLALLLAAIGIYGLMSYTVEQRMQEFGIRLALGAATRDMLAMIVRQGMLLAGIGLVIGLGAAYGAPRAAGPCNVRYQSERSGGLHRCRCHSDFSRTVCHRDPRPTRDESGPAKRTALRIRWGRSFPCQLLRRFSGRRRRLRSSPMAGIASHMRLPIREFGIDVLRHGDHMPRDLFGMLFVTRKVALHVTEVALLRPTQPQTSAWSE